MKGITLYPLDEYKTKDSVKWKQFKDKWINDKKDLIGDDYFIVSGNLSEKAKQIANEINNQDVEVDDFLYDTKRFYDLICAYTHVSTKKKKDFNEVLTLGQMVDQVIRAGANIEEIKFLALASVFFNVDPIIDRENEDYDILMSKINFAFKVAGMVDTLSNISPYNEMFKKSYESRENPNEDTKNAVAVEFLNYDTNNLEYICECKLNSMLLKAILSYRFDYKDFEKSVLAKIFFKIRKITEANAGKNKGFFKYEIKESAKKDMSELFRNPSYNKYAVVGAKFSADRMLTPDQYFEYRSIATIKYLSEFSREYKHQNSVENRENE